MRFNVFFTLIGLCTACIAGPYPAEVGNAGSDAISKSDTRIVNWANGHEQYHVGTGVDPLWQTPTLAYAPALGSYADIVCLGNGGQITIVFPYPIRDGAGADFAVFENSFSHSFLELAFVEVSSDGVHFFRFPSHSLTPADAGSFIDPTDLDGLASKYIEGHGTPFDLSRLPQSSLLDIQRIRFVRLIDIIGDGSQQDSHGNAIYDPNVGTGSSGFDLEAIGVLHENRELPQHVKLTEHAQSWNLSWDSNPGSDYRIESSADLIHWQFSHSIKGKATSNTSEMLFKKTSNAKQFWRISVNTP